jgi:hypothetical protein
MYSRRLDPPYFDIAQICLNGHVINSNYSKEPLFNKQYCDRCGGRTITECPKCAQEIKGEYEDPQSHVAVIGFFYKPPSFCEPFPWTSSTLKAARELTNSLDLSDDQKKELKKDIDEMVKDEPRAIVAAKRFKNTLEDRYQQIPTLYHDLLIGVLPAAVSTSYGRISSSWLQPLIKNSSILQPVRGRIA